MVKVNWVTLQGNSKTSRILLRVSYSLLFQEFYDCILDSGGPVAVGSTPRDDNYLPLLLRPFSTLLPLQEVPEKSEGFPNVEVVQIKRSFRREQMPPVDEGGDDGGSLLVGHGHCVVMEPRQLAVIGRGQEESLAVGVEGPRKQVISLSPML